MHGYMTYQSLVIHFSIHNLTGATILPDIYISFTNAWHLKDSQGTSEGPLGDLWGTSGLATWFKLPLHSRHRQYLRGTPAVLKTYTLLPMLDDDLPPPPNKIFKAPAL